MKSIRHPCQAGRFYEDSAESLRKQIESCFLHKMGPGRIPKAAKNGPRQLVGLICPHAGYMASGPVAAHAYYTLALDGKPDVAVLLGPNHTGYGSALAIMNEGVWRTPLGDVEIDERLADRIASRSRIIDVDSLAHRFEHSIEVQLPFLQYLCGPSLRIVPICFRMQDWLSAKEAGEAVAEVVDQENGIMIASSDLTHYESQSNAEQKDRRLLKAVEAMNPAEFYALIESLQVSACGYGPIAASVQAARKMGVKKATLLSYRTSGDVIGDYSSVVGYAALSFMKV